MATLSRTLFVNSLKPVCVCKALVQGWATTDETALNLSSISGGIPNLYIGHHRNQLSGGSIWHSWCTCLSSTNRTATRGGAWISATGGLASRLRSSSSRTRGRWWRSTRQPSAAGEISSFFRLGAMAPELSTSEPVDGTTTAAQNGEGKRVNQLGAVFFDMDDTLVLTHEVDSKAHLAVMALVAVRAPQVDQYAVLSAFLERFHREAWDPEHKVEVTEWRARLWSIALKGQGIEDMDLARDCQNCFDRERLQGFRWTSGVERLVRNLHRQGIKVGIITNGHAQVQRAKLKACNAEELFDTILVGGEEPNMKPHRDIFIKACNLAGCKPEESMMVGDTLKADIQGGINAGFLSTVWVNVHHRDPRPGSAKPDHEIATFVELQHVLEQYGVVFEAE